MNRVLALVFVVTLLLPVTGFSQFKDQEAGKINFASLLSGGLQPRGLIGMIGLDPSRFHMSQSYTLSLMTIGGQSFSQGVYLNTMRYDFNVPVTVSLQWGVMHSPLSAAGVNSLYNNGVFLSGASVEYKPSENFEIGIQYSSYPHSYFYNRPYSHRWYR